MGAWQKREVPRGSQTRPCELRPPYKAFQKFKLHHFKIK
jgi:hypothetical protein